MKLNNFLDFQRMIPRNGQIYFEALRDPFNRVVALLHFVTPPQDRHKYLDTDVYWVRTWDKETGDPDKIQFYFQMSSKYDGSFTLKFTDSPVYGKDETALQNIYGVIPYVHSITPDKVTSRIAKVSEHIQ